MAARVRVQAAAKVNLHLRVYNRRSDGYHDILSLFQAVSLADTVVIRSLKESDTIEIEGNFDCAARDTTVYRATEAYRNSTGIRTGVAIAVEKRIPAGAGLGGGSSDGAAVLAGLEALLGGDLGADELYSLGASIGSDVPFFQRAAAAIVSGRGDVVEPIAARDDFELVVCFPGFPVSTAWAYALLDRERPDGSSEPDPRPRELEAAYRSSPGSWPFANSFEPFVGAAEPAVLEAKELLVAAGASFAAMSGSGSAVFGAFVGGDPGKAIDQLRARGFDAYAVSPLARCMTLD
jgi:4-diphosphocytidyl-2-C-methyl-D-erythritol kinase